MTETELLKMINALEENRAPDFFQKVNALRQHPSTGETVKLDPNVAIIADLESRVQKLENHVLNLLEILQAMVEHLGNS